MTLAYIPFLEPLPIHDLWYLLLLPLSFGISVIYKALRMANLDRFWLSAFIMTVQIVGAMIALAIGLGLLIQLVIPMLPVAN